MKNDILMLLGLIIAIVVLLILAKTYSFIPQFRTSLPLSTSVNMSGATFKVEVANTAEKRSKGLSGKDSLAENTGMLFVFDKQDKYQFWMKNTKIALDIVWISEDKKIVDFYQNAQPEPNIPDSQLKKYAPSQQVLYVLEINANSIEKYGIHIGDKVDFKL
jgi:uncharacterized membrane protein (UPF0127 family)